MLENQQKHMDKMLNEDKLSTSLDPSNILKTIRLSFPNTVKADLIKEWPMGGINKYELTKSKGKNFIDGFEDWLKPKLFDKDGKSNSYIDDDYYDIKKSYVKQYMMEKFES